MPKLSEAELNEVKSFLDFLIENGIKGSNTEGEEQAALGHELVDFMDKTPTVVIGRAAAFLDGASKPLALMYNYRQKIEAN